MTKSEPFHGRSAEMRKPTPWLSSEDLLEVGEVPAEIEGVYLHKDAMFDDGRKENVYGVRFVKKEKELILNATNRKTLVNAFGVHVKNWSGKKVLLYVQFGVKKVGGAKGETTCGIRVKVPAG
jgi:hypothetical protein